MGIGNMLSKIFGSEGVKDPKSSERSDDVHSAENISHSKGQSPEEVGSRDKSSATDEGNVGRAESLQESGPTSGEGHSSEEDSTAGPVTKEKVLEVLSDVYDPEIPIDIVNLGLIYGVDIDNGIVHVKMTMTAPGCPASAEIAAESRILIEELPGVESATIEIVWDPPWDPSKMSEDARQSMGF